MAENDGAGAKLLYFIVGGFIGAAIALLFAPRSGQETRELLSSKARESRERLAAKGRELKEQAASYLEKGKETILKQKDQLAAAIEAGKQAYREEKEKAESD